MKFDKYLEVDQAASNLTLQGIAHSMRIFTQLKLVQKKWSLIDQTNYSTSVGVSEMCSDELDRMKDDARNFALMHMCNHPTTRDDYREFLELSLIFLGSSPARGIHFMAPGPMHHARWMSKVIYSLKVWMFRSQFMLTAVEERRLG